MRRGRLVGNNTKSLVFVPDKHRFASDLCCLVTGDCKQVM